MNKHTRPDRQIKAVSGLKDIVLKRWSIIILDSLCAISNEDDKLLSVSKKEI